MDTDTTNDATRFCRLLARALRRRLQPADGFGRLPEARHGPSSEEAARCVVRAAGASGCGGLFDREALPCSVGAEDGAIYRMWRWLSVAWPLNILLYVLTLPLAELLWCLASRHYLRVRSATPHVVRLGHADAAIALRYYRRLPKERTPAQLEALLRRWFHGQMPTREQVTSFLGWTIYDAIGEELGPARAAAVAALIDDFSAALGSRFATGAASGGGGGGGGGRGPRGAGGAGGPPGAPPCAAAPRQGRGRRSPPGLRPGRFLSDAAKGGISQ